MADKLIGDPITHPSRRLEAGQVVGFGEPDDEAICPRCGHEFGDVTFHPGGFPSHLVVFGGDPVTYGGQYVVYGA